MSQETWQAGIGEQLDALEADIERFGVAMNAGGTWTTALGETLKTLPELIKYLQDRLTGVLNKGEWQGDTHYALNDMVLADGNYYVCGVPHTSTAFADDLAAGKWALWPTGSSNIDLSDALTGTRQASDGVAASEWALAQVNSAAVAAGEAAADARAAADEAMGAADRAAAGLATRKDVTTSGTFSVTKTGLHIFRVIAGGGAGGGTGKRGGGQGGNSTITLPVGAIVNGITLTQATTYTATGGSGGGGTWVSGDADGGRGGAGGGEAGEVLELRCSLTVGQSISCSIGAGGGPSTTRNTPAKGPHAGRHSDVIGASGYGAVGAEGAWGAANGSSGVMEHHPTGSGSAGNGGHGGHNGTDYGSGGGGAGGNNAGYNRGFGGPKMGNAEPGQDGTNTPIALGGAGGNGAVIIEY